MLVGDAEDRRADECADGNPRRPGAQDSPIHRAGFRVGRERAPGGGDDGGERGADRDLHAHVIVHAQRAEQRKQGWNNDNAAADAKQAADKAREQTRPDEAGDE